MQVGRSSGPQVTWSPCHMTPWRGSFEVVQHVLGDSASNQRKPGQGRGRTRSLANSGPILGEQYPDNRGPQRLQKSTISMADYGLREAAAERMLDRKVES